MVCAFRIWKMIGIFRPCKILYIPGTEGNMELEYLCDNLVESGVPTHSNVNVLVTCRRRTKLRPRTSNFKKAG